MNKLLISIIGPTAIGKTKLAILLASHFKTEIISADSRQFFKEMRIGTAVPSETELSQVKHHFIQHKSVMQPYTVGDFERESIQKLSELFKIHDVVVMVGGSGLYVNAVTKGLNAFPDIDAEIREQLNQDLKTYGLESLQERLKQKDPTYYEKVDIHNPQRVIRALEVCIGSGKPYSSFIKKPTSKRNFKVLSIGLKAERSLIYERINERVDSMMEEGLLAEAEALVPYRTQNALQTVGYKELFQYFDGTWTLDFAISEIKKNTRRFAKRQLTWFLKNERTLWFDHDYKEKTVIKRTEEEIKKIQMATSKILFVMGVSGSGKTTIGELLAEQLGIPFFDGDDFHPEANIKKMSEGRPLDDEDRQGWLNRLNELALQHTTSGAVIVCSALKDTYRTLLGKSLDGQHRFIYLKGSFDLINNRLAQRENHYMPKDLLRSQFETLVEPKDALTISIDQTPQKIVYEIIAALKN